MTKEIIFPFSIIRIMHPTSNISSKMFYSAFEAEIPQTACTTSKCETFCKASEILIIRLNRQGDDINVFRSTWAIIYGRHFLHLESLIIAQKSLLTLQLNNFDNFLDCSRQGNLFNFSIF